MNPRRLLFLVHLCFAAGLAGSAHAEMYIYPSKGQSQAKENKDKQACQEWSVQQTGINPETVEEQSQKAAEMGASGNYDKGRELFGGGARGAALGAVGGAIGGNAGKGAAIGAAVGGLMSVFRAHRQTEERHAYYSDQIASEKAKLKTYDQAYATCLRGRGYTVSE